MKDFVIQILECKPVAYRSDFAKISESVTAGVMLSQAFYWDGKSTKHGDGWFEKDQSEMYDETGLTDKQQQTARHILNEKGFMESKRKGDRGKLCYRVNKGNVYQALVAYYADRQKGGTVQIGKRDGVDRQKGSSKNSKKANLSLQRLLPENTTENTTPSGAGKTQTQIHDEELDKAISYILEMTRIPLKADKSLKIAWYNAIRLDGLNNLKWAIRNYCESPINREMGKWAWWPFFTKQAVRAGYLPKDGAGPATLNKPRVLRSDSGHGVSDEEFQRHMEIRDAG